MIKVNLNSEIKLLDGNPLVLGGKPYTLRKALADILSKSPGDAVRLMDLAQRIYNGEGPVEMTPAEKALCLESLEAADVWPLIKAPLKLALQKI